MFEIEPRSNLGPLVMAVLVGLLSLAANHYRKLDIDTLDSMLTDLTTSEETETKPVSAFGMNPELKALKDKLPQVGRRASECYEQWQNRYLSLSDPELNAAIADVKPFAVQLPSILKQFDREEQLAVLRLLFVAESMRPGRFSKSFRSLCKHLESANDEMTRSTAGVLDYLHKHNLTNPDPSRLLPGLRTFSQKYKDPRCGVHLYAIVAEAFWSKGYADYSEQVLRRGIKVYSGTPGVSRLVNQMVDQRSPSY